MKPFLILCLIAFGASSPAPQYSGQTSDLSEKDIETVKDIFGDAGIYGGEQTGKINEGDDNYGGEQSEKLNEDGYVAPDDYLAPQSADQTKTTNNVDNVFESCSDYENQGYYCVPYYQCEAGIIVTDGAGLIDIRNGFGILSPEDSKCEGFLDVCCLDPDFEAPPPEPVVKHIPQCGTRHQNGLGVRIQGFNEGESQFGEWPHMCAVLTEEPIADAEPGYAPGDESQTVNLYQCGGSLIAPGVILTAAHCLNTVPDTASIKVRCGEWDTQNQNEPREHQDRYAVNKDIHPAFNPRNLANDWALLYLESPFELQEHIDTVCLPQPGELFTGTDCFATGWGKDKFGSQGEYQVVLKEIDLPVVNHAQCQADLRTTRLGKRFKLDESFICAGGEGAGGKDTCKGDGGSPLVCPSKYDPNTYVQAGIVAWGIGCGEKNIPGVYASVAEAVCWIDMAMSCNSGSTSSYWGYGEECDSWFINQSTKLNEDLAKMQDSSLKGRKKIEALVNGQKAQKVLDYFNGCPVEWAPVGQLVNGGEGYVDSGEIIDISTNERDNYPAEPLTDSGYSDTKTNPTGPLTDGSYPTEPLTDGSYPSEPLTDGSYPSEPLTDGSYPSEPLTDGSYPDQLPVDPHVTAPLTSDGQYSEPKIGDQTDGSYTEDSSPVKIVDGTYTGDTADLTGDVKVPGPVY